MTRRALSFGTDADAYDRHRPGYPGDVVDLAVRHATGPVERAVEVGAGTGKATVAFATRGIHVTAVEPDPAMRAVLARQVDGLPVQVVAATFEEVDPVDGDAFDLLFAAAAFHWTAPATRWQRAAALVRPGGVVALFGAERRLVDDDLAREVDRLLDDAAAAEQADSSGDDGDVWTGWTVDDLRARPEFTDVVEATVPRQVTLTEDEFIAHLSTVSAYLVLPAARRAALLADTRAALPDSVDVAQDLLVHLARRA